MRRNQINLFMMLMFLSAMFGGGFTTWLLRGQLVYADSKPSQRLVAAEEFRLVDADGKTKALFALKDGYPNLILFDGKHMRLMLQVDESISAVRIFDRNGYEACNFMVSGEAKGGEVRFGVIKHIPYLRLDKKGSGGCFLRSESDMPRFSLYSQDHKEQPQDRMIIGVDKDIGALLLGDESTGIGLYLREDRSFISIYQDGKSRWQTPSP